MDESIEYNRHYIRVDEKGRVTGGFSDAFRRPADGDLCINEQGGYQFRLVPGGEENPPLLDESGAHLYRWERGEVRPASQEELEQERRELAAAVPSPAPSLEERTEALETAVLELMAGGEIRV